MAEAINGARRKERRTISQSDFNRLLGVVLGAGLLVLAALGGTIVWLAVKTSEYNDWVDHTYVAQQRVVAFLESLERMETARRGYLLTPTPTQLGVYRTARSITTVQLYQLAQTTRDNPIQRANIEHIRPLLAWKIKVNDDSVAMVAAGHRDEALKAFPVEQALQPLLGIRAVTNDMLAEEHRLLTQRLEREKGAIRLLTYAGAAAAILLAVLTLIALLAMRRFAEDLTRAQAALRSLNQTLEQRVEDRTVDLTRANQEIQRFAYIVSHDLRSPLVNVMGFTSELEEAMKSVRALLRSIEEGGAESRLPEQVKRAVDADIPEAIGFIRASTRKMDGLIGAILKLSREGRRVLHPERLPMEPVVEGVLSTVKHRVGELGGEAVIEGELPDLVSDRLAIEQVLSNLIDNAVKYHSPKRPLHITVRGAEADGRVVLEVADNGRGVDPKDHERIFELFRRSGVQNQPGEGIGLAHVRALVHRLGGVITCTSALDQGAVFRLSLPRVLVPIEGLSA